MILPSKYGDFYRILKWVLRTPYSLYTHLLADQTQEYDCMNLSHRQSSHVLGHHPPRPTSQGCLLWWASPPLSSSSLPMLPKHISPMVSSSSSSKMLMEIGESWSWSPWDFRHCPRGLCDLASWSISFHFSHQHTCSTRVSIKTSATPFAH